MGISWSRFTEYDLQCDRCDSYETVYTGDSYNGKVVNSIQSAIYVAGFHRKGAKLICGKCFEAERREQLNQIPIK
jgi:hypothetical protein